MMEADVSWVGPVCLKFMQLTGSPELETLELDYGFDGVYFTVMNNQHLVLSDVPMQSVLAESNKSPQFGKGIT